MKKMNFLLAVTSFFLFLFLGVQGLGAQTSLTPSPFNQKDYVSVSKDVNYVNESDAINLLNNTAKDEFQTLKAGNLTSVQESRSSVIVLYYDYLVQQLNTGEVIDELMTNSIPVLVRICDKYKPSSNIDPVDVYTDTVDLLKL